MVVVGGGEYSRCIGCHIFQHQIDKLWNWLHCGHLLLKKEKEKCPLFSCTCLVMNVYVRERESVCVCVWERERECVCLFHCLHEMNYCCKLELCMFITGRIQFGLSAYRVSTQCADPIHQKKAPTWLYVSDRVVMYWCGSDELFSGYLKSSTLLAFSAPAVLVNSTCQPQAFLW